MQEEKGDDAAEEERLEERNRGGIARLYMCYRIDAIWYRERGRVQVMSVGL